MEWLPLVLLVHLISKTEKENEWLKAFIIDIINLSNDLMDMFILLREGREPTGPFLPMPKGRGLLALFTVKEYRRQINKRIDNLLARAAGKIRVGFGFVTFPQIIHTFHKYRQNERLVYHLSKKKGYLFWSYPNK
jgi:hypothetical protein